MCRKKTWLYMERKAKSKNTGAENIYVGKELLEVPMLLGTLFLRERIL
jgi:hypothetical protein